MAIKRWCRSIDGHRVDFEITIDGEIHRFRALMKIIDTRLDIDLGLISPQIEMNHRLTTKLGIIESVGYQRRLKDWLAECFDLVEKKWYFAKLMNKTGKKPTESLTKDMPDPPTPLPAGVIEG